MPDDRLRDRIIPIPSDSPGTTTERSGASQHQRSRSSHQDPAVDSRPPTWEQSRSRRTDPEEPELMKAKRRGHVLYRSSTGSRYVYFIAMLFFVSLLLSGYHPFFVAMSIVLLGLVITNVMLIPDVGITVYEKGILIPISRYKQWRYSSQGITYHPFISYRDVEFFYPCSFKIYRNVIIPNGITIKTNFTEYHLPHEFARVLSKKLRVALKDDFDKLYKEDYCIYRTSKDWNEVESRFSEYATLIGRTAVVYIILVLGILTATLLVAEYSGYPFSDFDPVIQVLIPLDIAIISLFLVNWLVPQLYRSFYHAVFRTWMAIQKGEKVPEKIRSSYRGRMKDRISRQADVLEIFDLDRKARFSRSFAINVVILIQIMLIFSVTPPEVFFGHETDYSDSGRFFGYEPLVIEKDIEYYNDTEVFAHEIASTDASIVLRNTTVWALGGHLLNITEGNSIQAENTRFFTPDADRIVRSSATLNSNHNMKRTIVVPEGVSNPRIEFISEYAMDYGFDFGYVGVSFDDITYEPLVGGSMTSYRNEDAKVGYDNAPGYTGTRDWFHDSVSLGDHRGEMEIRFHHVADDHQSVNSGNWKLTNINLVWDGGSEHLGIDDWDLHGWSPRRTEPDDYWMTIWGEGNFVNCDFTSFGKMEILSLQNADVTFTDCSFQKTVGAVIKANNSNIVMDRTFIDSYQDLLLANCQLELSNSIFRSEEFFDVLLDTFVKIRNCSFLRGEIDRDPRTIDYLGSTGIIVHREPMASFRFVDPLQNARNGIPILIERMNEDGTAPTPVVNDVTNGAGRYNFSSPSGYEFIGTAIPRNYLDQHLIHGSAMYRISIANQTFYRYLGMGDYDETLILGDLDLKPVIDSFDYEYNEELMKFNVSCTIINSGTADSTNFTISWYDGQDLITFSDMYLPAGQTMDLNTSLNGTGYCSLTLDQGDSQIESDEANNDIMIEYLLSGNTRYDRIYFQGDYIVKDLALPWNIRVEGNLAIIDGTINFSNPKNYSRLLDVSDGGLFVSNVIDRTEGIFLELSSTGPSSIHRSQLSAVDLSLHGPARIHDSAIDDIDTGVDTIPFITESVIGSVDINRGIPYMRISDSSLEYLYTRSTNGMVENCEFTSETMGTAIRTYYSNCHFENNVITGYPLGFLNEYSSFIARDNEISDCVLGIQVEFGAFFVVINAIDFIEDFISHTTFTNCNDHLEYTHQVDFAVLDEEGDRISDVFSSLVKSNDLDSNDFHVLIEQGDTVIRDYVYERTYWFSLDLVQFSIDGNGTYIYPEYRITIEKDFYGYHQSTFSNVSERIDLTMVEKGDSHILDVRIQPGPSDGVLLNVSIDVLGLPMTNVNVGVFESDEKIGSIDFPSIDPDEIAHGEYNLPQETAIKDLSFRITSPDPYPFNNEYRMKIRTILQDEVISAGPLDLTLIIGADAHVRIENGDVEFMQERDNQCGILILEGGNLIIEDVTMNSSYRYSIINHGSLEIKNSVIHRPGNVFTIRIEDGMVYGSGDSYGSETQDPFLVALDSGLINYGSFTLEDSTIIRGGIYSRDDLVIRNSAMTDTYYPYSHPEYRQEGSAYGLFASGSVIIDRSNLSHYRYGQYLYQAEFEIIDSDFQYSFSPQSNYSVDANWAIPNGGQTILASNGSITDSRYVGYGLDIRNSTIDVQGNFFSTEYQEQKKLMRSIMRNTKGTFSGNEIIYNYSYYYGSDPAPLVIKDSPDLTVRDNDISGVDRGTAIAVYYSPPSFLNNTIRNFTYAFQSYGAEFDITGNTLLGIQKKDYSQWYLIDIVPDDGYGHQIEDLTFNRLDGSGRWIQTSNQVLDPMYHQEFLVENRDSGTRTHLLTWLEEYSILDGTITDHSLNTFRIYKRSAGTGNGVNLTIHVHASATISTVLPIAEIGVNMRFVPDTIVREETTEFITTVYNNGSSVDYGTRITFRAFDKNHRQLYSDSEIITVLLENSSVDITFQWAPKENEFIIELEADSQGPEASTSNNTFLITLSASDPKTEDTTKETTFRALILFFIIFGVLIAGSSFVKRSMKERSDAMGINFDAEEFRRSLRRIGTISDDPDTGHDDWDGDEGGTGGEGSAGLDGDDLMGPDADPQRPGGEKPPPPLANIIYIPGKDICPECRRRIGEPDPLGITSCNNCGWMKFEKRSGESEEFEELT
jgi:hypothetical protein